MPNPKEIIFAIILFVILEGINSLLKVVTGTLLVGAVFVLTSIVVFSYFHITRKRHIKYLNNIFNFSPSEVIKSEIVINDSNRDLKTSVMDYFLKLQALKTVSSVKVPLTRPVVHEVFNNYKSLYESLITSLRLQQDLREDYTPQVEVLNFYNVKEVLCQYRIAILELEKSLFLIREGFIIPFKAVGIYENKLKNCSNNTDLTNFSINIYLEENLRFYTREEAIKAYGKENFVLTHLELPYYSAVLLAAGK